MVESIVGTGVSVYFSEIFFKPPKAAGQPGAQDNFYFGPNDPDGLVTAWVALDDATVENGCLLFGEGTNLGPVHSSRRPPANRSICSLPEDPAASPDAAAPVPRGGISFHHGNTFHQSSANRRPLPPGLSPSTMSITGTRFVTPPSPTTIR